MNISFQWLKALLPDLTASPDEVGETLALRGAPLEEFAHLAPGLEGVVVEVTRDDKGIYTLKPGKSEQQAKPANQEDATTP